MSASAISYASPVFLSKEQGGVGWACSGAVLLSVRSLCEGFRCFLQVKLVWMLCARGWQRLGRARGQRCFGLSRTGLCWHFAPRWPSTIIGAAIMVRLNTEMASLRIVSELGAYYVWEWNWEWNTECSLSCRTQPSQTVVAWRRGRFLVLVVKVVWLRAVKGLESLFRKLLLMFTSRLPQVGFLAN